MSEIAICAHCRHMRQKQIADPFSNRLDVWTPDILEAKTKWEEQQREVAIVEEQRYLAGEEFDYEPNNYPWCAAWTEVGKSWIDPVTGERSKFFVLCAHANPDGTCERYESKR